MKKVVCIVFYLLITFSLQSQITLPSNGCFDDLQVDTAVIHFTTHEQAYKGGYQTKDSTGGSYLFFSANYAASIPYNVCHRDEKIPGGNKLMVVYNNNHPAKRNELLFLGLSHPSEWGTESYNRIKRLQIADTLVHIYFAYDKYGHRNDMLIVWVNDVWIHVMPCETPTGTIYVTNDGIVKLFSKHNNIFYAYHLAHQHGAYYWIRDLPARKDVVHSDVKK